MVLPLCASDMCLFRLSNLVKVFPQVDPSPVSHRQTFLSVLPRPPGPATTVVVVPDTEVLMALEPFLRGERAPPEEMMVAPDPVRASRVVVPRVAADRGPPEGSTMI